MSQQTLSPTNSKQTVYNLLPRQEYRKAGPSDLIALLPVPRSHSLVLPKKLLEAVVYGVVAHEFIHLSGPSGTCKTSLIEALFLVQRNFVEICEELGYDAKPLHLLTVEMATYESPSELYQRRALKDGCTYDEESRLVAALKDAAANREKCHPLIWLREMGRVHSPNVQGGLLNLISHQDIVLPDGTRIDGREIAWIADSNYQAENEATHTLVTFDDALKRRFSLNIKLGYLPPEQEAEVLHNIVADSSNGFSNLSKEEQAGLSKLIDHVVLLGQLIRSRKGEGELTSAPPPTIYGYLAFLRMAVSIPHCSDTDIAKNTLLGNISEEDEVHAAAILNEVFGLQTALEDEPTMGGSII